MTLVFYNAKTNKISIFIPELDITRTYYKNGGLKRIKIQSSVDANKGSHVIFVGIVENNYDID